METDIDNTFNIEWATLMNKHFQFLSTATCQTKKSLEEVIKYISKTEHKTTNENVATCRIFLQEATEFLFDQPRPFDQDQMSFLLDIGKFVATDETNFTSLQSTNTIRHLIFLSRPIELGTSKSVKINFMRLINSILAHTSGTQWLMETNYWIHIYTIIMECQNTVQEKLLKLGYNNLASLLRKTSKQDTNFCIDLIKFLVGPLMQSEQGLVNFKSSSLVAFQHRIYDPLRPSVLCLVQLLERVMENQDKNVLNMFLEVRVREICDHIASVSNDRDFIINLYRIVLMLSFFELSELFDGIQVVKQNHLSMSGIHRIMKRELERDDMLTIYEMLHYALLYSKSKSIRLPLYVIKRKQLDIESELIALQLETPCLIGEKLFGVSTIIGPAYTENIFGDLRTRMTVEVIGNCSVDSLLIGLEIRKKIPDFPIEIFIYSIEVVIKSKYFYSPKNLGLVVESLVYCIEDVFCYLKKEVANRVIKYEEQMLVETLLKAILEFIKGFNLSWHDSVKIIDLPRFIYDFLNSVRWPSPVVVKALKLLKLLIARYMSPSMVLLIDSTKDSSLGDITEMLYKKCFSSDWETRKAVVDVVTTLAYAANKSFPSFRDILAEASLTNLVSTLCFKDESCYVKAACFKCLQEVIMIENVNEMIPQMKFIDKVLDIVPKEQDSLVKKEALKFLTIAYWNEENKNTDYIKKLYDTMQKVCLTDKDSLVRRESITFWRTVTKHHMISVGYIDASFPSVTFSKRILPMTKEEIIKRIFKFLSDINKIGCLHMLTFLIQQKDLSEEVSADLTKWLIEFHDMFRKYQITPDSMGSNGDILDQSPVNLISTFNSNTEINLEEMIEELFDHFADLKDTEVPHPAKYVIPSEFVRFVYHTMTTIKDRLSILIEDDDSQNNTFVT